MARQFPLAGLLRLRQLREDEAAGSLAAANERLRASRTRTEGVSGALGGTDLDPAGAASLHAVAAARASARSMLADLQALEARLLTEQEHAQTTYRGARAATMGLEKLEARHSEVEATALLGAEQLVLDEIASAGRLQHTGKDRA
ncbi:flagellar FliJ family protein [Arthrobacter ruber]|uniref:flagellar FliJ family protein n=1 Tax=Arthrobacter ruber TaxID=1258893 RepID=UPI000CF55969|nr:flagellar FliJ family protein [Arthrobacter ruber]